MDRLFLDANVLFSAAYRAEAGVARLWQLKNIELITSPYSAEEARINLDTEEQQRRLAELLEDMVMVSELAPLPSGVELPDKDRPILQAALHARATHLLTGDKQHFGRYYGRRIGGIFVLPPGEYLRSR